MIYPSRWSTFIYRCTIAIIVGVLLTGCALPVKIGNTAGVPQNPRQGLLKSPLGTVEIQTGKAWSQLPTNGEPVFLAVGQHVRTGSLSSVQLSFGDGSLVNLDAASELSIDELDAGSQGQPRVIAMTQVSGKSQHSVAPASITNSRYEVHTPGGIATAKGTEFSVWMLPDQTSYLNVIKGAVVVIAAQVTVTVNPGQMTTWMIDHSPAVPSGYLSGEGPVTQTGESWIISGLTFKSQANTVQTGTIHLGDLVAFEGHLLADGSRILDRVVLLQPSPTNHFRMRGAAEKITATAWTVNGLAISVTPQTQIEIGIVEGNPVWVEGVILTSGVFQAEQIRKADDENGLPFKFSGSVQEIGADQWVIAGVTVRVNAQTILADGIVAGKLVRVSGHIQSDGTWLAGTIQLADENENPFEFSGKIVSMTPWKVVGVAFETRSWTQIDPDLKIGDLVQVSGSINSDGVWIASEIRRMPADEIRLILIGPVLSVNPWVVSGVPLKTNPQTIVIGNITVGMLVRVEARLLNDGTWEAMRIEPLTLFVWVPTCFNLNVMVVSLQNNLAQFQGWPQMPVPADFKLKDAFVPNTTALVQICVNNSFILQILSIQFVTIVPVPAPTVESDSDKVLICHKPGKKKGGQTMLLPRAALSGHLGHGDTLGACR
jgi:hypothetical protein